MTARDRLPQALFLGGHLPRALVGGIFFVLAVLSASCEPQEKKPPPSTVDLHLLATTTEGEPLAGVALVVGRSMAITEGSGEASLNDIRSDRALIVRASCPEGFLGAPLHRTLTRSALTSAAHWHLELVCEPREFDVSVAVLAEGCGAMSVSVDGVEIGSTQAELFHTVVRRAVSSRPEPMDISVRPLSGTCELTSDTKTFAPDARSPGIWAHFVGRAPIRAARRRSAKRAPEPRRPYKL